MDRRALAGAVVGLLGLGLGLAAVIWDAVAAGVLAGALALVGGVAVVRVVGLLRNADRRIAQLNDQVAELSGTVERETRAREDAETRLASRIQLTATRRATQHDALVDEATGLYSEGYFTVALEARIASARRNLKPVAVVLVEVIRGLDTVPQPADPVTVAASIRATVRESDTSCRLMDGAYALLLEDTPETGAIWTVERIRRHLAEADPGLTLWAGVACYPAHGFAPDEILDRADMALDLAREWRQDRIEVATAD